ncbi:MAG: threonine synthase, partial [Pseudorhizobium sp.]
MEYISTRGEAPALGFRDALLAGLARDGGLYMPREWPVLTKREIRSFRGLPYQDVAFEIVRRFTGDEIPAVDLRSMIAEAYATFRHPAVAPL